MFRGLLDHFNNEVEFNRCIAHFLVNFLNLMICSNQSSFFRIIFVSLKVLKSLHFPIFFFCWKKDLSVGHFLFKNQVSYVREINKFTFVSK